MGTCYLLTMQALEAVLGDLCCRREVDGEKRRTKGLPESEQSNKARLQPCSGRQGPKQGNRILPSPTEPRTATASWK